MRKGVFNLGFHWTHRPGSARNHPALRPRPQIGLYQILSARLCKYTDRKVASSSTALWGQYFGRFILFLVIYCVIWHILFKSNSQWAKIKLLNAKYAVRTCSGHLSICIKIACITSRLTITLSNISVKQLLKPKCGSPQKTNKENMIHDTIWYGLMHAQSTPTMHDPCPVPLLSASLHAKGKQCITVFQVGPLSGCRGSSALKSFMAVLLHRHVQ